MVRRMPICGHLIADHLAFLSAPMADAFRMAKAPGRSRSHRAQCRREAKLVSDILLAVRDMSGYCFCGRAAPCKIHPQ